MTDLLIEGRLVCGHPMIRRSVKKKQRGEPVETQVFNDDGSPTTDVYVAIAIPKNGSTDWKTTGWGQQIVGVAMADWPNGEHAANTFAWKITDGDSPVPNKVGKKPMDREGWSGHWVVHCTTRFGLQCFHVGKYDPMLDQIQDKAEIKVGDYARVFINVKGNNPSQSPGVYVNPKMFELSRAGQLIVSESGPNAADVFGGGGQPQGQPATAQHQPAQTPQVPIAPATDFVNGPGTTAAAPPPPPVEPKYVGANGGHFTAAQLSTVGYSPEQIAALPKAP
ncbi:MAG: hypothetical protein JRJ62_00175 [Deltaproteobacteria bacterium]|nr:hypothetical protein [Deltaproteobacteria bacterium]